MSDAFDFNKLIWQIASSKGFNITEITPLSGGSINEVFLLSGPDRNQVIKFNKTRKFPGMFQAEKEGLDLLRSTRTFVVPEVYSVGESGEFSFLLMEYLPVGIADFTFWKKFAEDLSALHGNTAAAFGFPSGNYIGCLPQNNENRASVADFYISQRLEPQIRMAVQNGFNFQSLDIAFKNISHEIPEEPPSLLHGDLWSGNYLVTSKGLPALIDPAVCYGPREMDLSMMKLFGGFPKEVFETYSDLFPLQPNFAERIPLWQLYYLLVHLNIFGKSYYSSVKSILDHFSN